MGKLIGQVHFVDSIGIPRTIPGWVPIRSEWDLDVELALGAICAYQSWCKLSPVLIDIKNRYLEWRSEWRANEDGSLQDAIQAEGKTARTEKREAIGDGGLQKSIDAKRAIDESVEAAKKSVSGFVFPLNGGDTSIDAGKGPLTGSGELVDFADSDMWPLIDPLEFAHMNDLGAIEGQIVALVTQWRKTRQRADLERVEALVGMLKSLEFPETVTKEELAKVMDGIVRKYRKDVGVE